MAETADTGEAIIRSLLASYGFPPADLEEIVGRASSLIKENPALYSANPKLVVVMSRDTQAYKNRFPGNVKLAAAKKPVLDEDTYLAYESSMKQNLYANGLPRGFYDSTEDLGDLISKDLSPTELNDRIQAGYTAVRNADPAVRAELEEMYGWTPGDLAAYYLDPTKTLETTTLRTRTQAAFTSFEARRQAGIDLSTAEAEALAREGVTTEQAQAGFGAIAQQQQLYEPLQGEQAITQAEQIAGTFGTNTAAAQRIAQRRRSRQAEFEAGGGFAGAQTGTIGLRTVGE